MIPIFESHIFPLKNCIPSTVAIFLNPIYLANIEIFVFSIVQNKISEEEDLHRNLTYSIVTPCKIMVCIYTSTFYNIEV